MFGIDTQEHNLFSSGKGELKGAATYLPLESKQPADHVMTVITPIYAHHPVLSPYGLFSIEGMACVMFVDISDSNIHNSTGKIKQWLGCHFQDCPGVLTCCHRQELFMVYATMFPIPGT